MRTGMHPATAAIVLFIIPYFGALVLAFKISPFQGAPKATGTGLKNENDLSSLLYTKPDDQQGIFSSAVQLLNSMKSSPSCNRLAVTNLITSCQQLNPDNTGSPMESAQKDLDHIKSLYAARLAVCEVSGAGARVPDECSQLVVPHLGNPSRTWFQGSDRDAELPTSQLELCLRALESKPQWWTSYSNNRQNAAIMCQAARIEVERDELLNHHRKLVDVTFGLSESLNQSLSHAKLDAEKQRMFLVAVDEMRLKLVAEMTDSESATRVMFKGMVTDIEAVFQQAVANIQTHIATAGSNTAVLSEDIQSSVASVHNLRQSLDKVYLNAMKQTTDLAAVEQEKFRANSEMALAVRKSLAEIQQQGMQVMAAEFGSIQSSLESLRNLVIFINENRGSLDERLNFFYQTFEHLEEKAGALDLVLQRHIENTTRLQQDIETDMRVAQALLQDVTTSAANLQTTITETYHVMSKIGSLGIVTGVVPWWGWLLAFVCLVGLLSPRVVALVFLAFACLSSTGAISTLRNMNLPPLGALRLNPHLEVACFLFGFVMSVAVVIFMVKKGFYHRFYVPGIFTRSKELPTMNPRTCHEDY